MQEGTSFDLPVDLPELVLKSKFVNEVQVSTGGILVFGNFVFNDLSKEAKQDRVTILIAKDKKVDVEGRLVLLGLIQLLKGLLLIFENFEEKEGVRNAQIGVVGIPVEREEKKRRKRTF